MDEKKVAYHLTSDDLLRFATKKLDEYEKKVEIKRNAVLDLMKFIFIELEGNKDDKQGEQSGPTESHGSAKSKRTNGN